ncbi:hypothetical protein M885DRAFT_610645 [Pelagophyceae sp. CCMP2097]|nr:hypothetical protein M885DRAFT_610645 [Pelagophyceae sp. CCMP2097]
MGLKGRRDKKPLAPVPGAGGAAAGGAAAEAVPAVRHAQLLGALTRDERKFVEAVTVDATSALDSGARGGPREAALREAAMKRCSAEAVAAIRAQHCCVILGALAPGEVEDMLEEYASHARVAAIGEKAASKRSGTRFFNCTCQLGPACAFGGWMPTAPETRKALLGRDSVWRRAVEELGFGHVARVEVVTGHAGARCQDWHVDGIHGLTVIFALVDVDAARGPTQLDFAHTFLDVDGATKVKGGVPGMPADARVHAGALPRGAVLLFNANVSHRGTANLSATDRPVLVLDTSPPCGHSTAGFERTFGVS